MASAPKLRSLYRAFLRELPPRPLLASPRSPLHAQVRAEFESSSSSSSPSSTSVLHAEQYLVYLQAQRTYTTLLERYNPGVAGDMDEQERVRLSARRVGINLPKEFGADSEGSGTNGGA